MAKAIELATVNVVHIKEKETDEVNKMCAESNAFELRKKKNMFGVRWEMARETLTVSSVGKDVCDAA